MKIGFLGGSFDPVHRGHLGVARAVADALSLEQVLLVPAAQAPLRDDLVRVSGAQRMAMLQLAVTELRAREGEKRLGVSDIELRRGGLSYTVDTLRALRVERPDDELFWIVGADQLARLPGWREPEELARLANWAVYCRPGHGKGDGVALKLPLFRLWRVEPEAGLWDISSSEIRARLAAGKDASEWLPDKVVEYIRQNGLYRGQ
jgi:nicotinate-nucleotide adenylyltransferase